MRLLSEQNVNILTSTLSLLNVRYSEYANKYFNEHPHKYSLFGLSKMLSYYGVRNMGVKVLNKEDIHSLESPFVAHLGNVLLQLRKFLMRRLVIIGMKRS